MPVGRRHELVKAYADAAESRMQELSVEQLAALYSLLGRPTSCCPHIMQLRTLQLTAHTSRRAALNTAAARLQMTMATARSPSTRCRGPPPPRASDHTARQESHTLA